MAARTTSEERLARLSEICLAFPKVTRIDSRDHTSFLVSKKILAYYLNNHHGDNILSVCCKVMAGDNERLVQANPHKFYLPMHIGPRGWVGFRLDLAGVDWREVKELVQTSYEQVAPKKLLALLKA
jgi:hypothetical protein